MDPLEPIGGVSLEKYAELCAKMQGLTTDDEFGAVAEQNGVDRPTWDAAREGWNARMYNPQTAAAVAMAYHPLLQAALAQFASPPPEVDFDQYVKMYAMVMKQGEPKMYETYTISPAHWSQVSTSWVGKLTADRALADTFTKAATEEMERYDKN